MSNQSLVVAVISPERRIHDEIASALNGNPNIETLWSLVEYPDPAALSEIRRGSFGCVVFLDFSDPIRSGFHWFACRRVHRDIGFPIAPD